jgi:Kef-type K+ transport system membrane component KefB
MNGLSGNLPLAILLIGLTVVAAMLVRGLCRRAGVPSLVGYMLLGVVIRLADSGGLLLSPDILALFEILAGIGIIALLFRVGIEAEVRDMLGQLRRAAWVWAGNVGLSGALGFATAFWLLGLDLVPSLFAGVALTATSLGVCLGIWREANRLNTPAGALLTDVAELDDISGIVLMILLLSAAPVIAAGNGGVASALGGTLVEIAVKIVLFAAVCFAFARYLEHPLTAFFERLEPAPNPMLPIVGMALVFASIAGWLGFSLAIGALFAGLIFSRERSARKVHEAFTPLYDFFVPFFFVNIGLVVEPGYVLAGLAVGLPLLVAGTAGKIAGTLLPALPMTSVIGGLVLGISMVPRAEIALIVASEGRKLGDWAVPHELFGALVFVSLASSLVSPIVVARILARWTPRLSGDG